MLVKLHSTALTAQRLSINLCALTSRCCFGHLFFCFFFCLVPIALRNINCVCIICPWPVAEIDWEERKWETKVKKKELR